LDRATPFTVSFLANSMALSDILVICPWLNTDKHDKPTPRSHIGKALATHCVCLYSYADGFYSVNPNHRNSGFLNGEHTDPACRARHPVDEFPEWSLEKTQVFLAAYGSLQTKVNGAKAEQLRTLARLYEKHHTRLKEPRAPQTQRTNIGHIPAQLERTAQSVLGTIDVDRRGQERTKEVEARFRYVHACLVPYDWCLRLYGRVEGVESLAEGWGGASVVGKDAARRCGRQDAVSSAGF
jgi:hypothetical protein